MIKKTRKSPVSKQQLGMLTDIEIKNDPSIYHIAKAIRISKKLDPNKLKNAFDLFFHRHDILSQTFIKEENLWYSHKNTSLNEVFSVLEIEDSEITSFFEKELKKPFDIQNGPLFKVFHIRSADHDHIFFHAHHLVIDLWSLGIFLEELFSLYNGEHLASFPGQYQEYISFQQENLESNQSYMSLDYWKKMSHEYLGNLGYIESRNEKKESKDSKIALHSFNISKTLGKQIQAISKEFRVRPVSFFLAIYSYLIFLNSGKTKSCFGTTTHGRPSSRFFKSIGLYSNSIPIFSTIHLSTPFFEHAKNLQKQLIANLKKHQLPLSQLTANVDFFKNQDTSQIFKNMFVYQQVPAVNGELKKLALPASSNEEIFWKSHQLSSSSWNHPFSPFELTFYMDEIDGNFRGLIEYRENLFPFEKIQSLCSLFLSLIEYFTSNPSENIFSFKSVPKVAPIRLASPFSTLIDHFTSLAIDNPSVAAVQSQRSLSYQSLDTLSNQYARFLLKSGAHPDSIIAVQMNFCIELYIVLLGIWKIGATLVPIDISVSAKQLENILEDCTPKLFINHLDIQELSGFSTQKINLSTSWESIAYIIYTSGSTGKPKGVAISHKALMSYLHSIDRLYFFKDAVHFAVYSSFSFDLTLTSICYPIFKGFTARFYDRNAEISTVLTDIMNDAVISHFKCTPSHLKIIQWLDTSLSNIREIIVGGEQLSTLLANDIKKRFKHLHQITNEYGPTEATIGCISYLDLQENHPIDHHVPIGKPLENTLALSIGPTYEPQETSNELELLIGGIGLAYGYWNQPRLTAEKFIPDPSNPGKRLYKTGDICEINSKGEYVFIRRDDNQIKIRGHRVEPSYIEVILQKCPDISNAAVTSMYSTRSQSIVLVAYCVLKKMGSIEQVKSFAKSQLSSYMIPSAFISCDELPISPNGKIDLSSLPRIDSCDDVLPVEDNILDLEQEMIDLFSKILDMKQENIRTTHTFYELGGDSIKAIQIVALAKEKGWKIKVSDILSGLSIAELCRTLDAIKTKRKARFENLNFSIPLTPIQQHFFIHTYKNPNYYHQAVTLTSAMHFEVEKIKTSLTQIFLEQPLLRSRFPNSDQAELSADISSQFTFEIHDFKQTDNYSDQLEKIKESLKQTISIKHGPLFRAALIQLKESDVLFLVSHHLIIDGVSWHIFLQSFDHYYSGLNKKSNNLDLLDSLDQYISFFDKKTSTFHTFSHCSYPIDSQEHLQLILDKNSTEFLFKADKKVRIDGIILAHLCHVLKKCLDLKEIKFDVEGHGRTYDKGHQEFSNLIGWFTELSTITIDMANHDFKSIHRQVRHQLSQNIKEKTTSSILFNYLGEINTRQYRNFVYEPEWKNLIDPTNEISYSIIVNAAIIDGSLQFFISFDTSSYPETIRHQIMSSLNEQLRSNLKFEQDHSKIPRDFGAVLPLDEWDQLLSKLEKRNHIVIQDIEAISPLLPSQKGIYLHSLQNPNQYTYIQQVILSFDGQIDDTLLQEAFEACIKRFPALRTSFHYENLKMPHRVVLKNEAIQVEKIEQSIEKHLEKDREKRFDLSKGPLIRFAIATHLPTKNLSLVFTYHHLIMDGWSLSNFFKTFLRELEKISNNQSDTFPPYTLLTPDSVTPIESEKQYWKKLLKDIDRPSSFPKNHKVVENSTKLLTYSSKFSKDLVNRLEIIAQKGDVTLSSLLHALWTYLVSRYSNNNDVVFGTVTSGRNAIGEPHIEDQVDQLSMTIPLRSKISHTMTILDLAKSIQNQLIESEKTSSLSTGEIMSQSSLNQNLFEHIFIFENYPFSGQAAKLTRTFAIPLTFKSASIIESSHYPFAISFLPSDGLHLEIQYDPKEFSAFFIENIAQDFNDLFELMTTNPYCNIHEISFEKSKKVSLKNLPLKFTSIIERFYHQASKSPQNIAIVHENQQLSYENLDILSTKLANYLIDLGFGQEDLVGIKMQKSIPWVIIWLGIMKAGCTYVPMSTKIPADRLSMILSQTDLKLIISDSDDEEIQNVNVLNQSKIFKEMQKCTSIPPPFPEQLAYVLFTSGSTGIPKGIGVPHSSISNHLQWIEDTFDLSSSDRMLQLTAVTFDVSVCELYAVIVGGTLVIPPFEENIDIINLVQVIQSNQVSFLQMAPSLLETLLNPEVMNQIQSVRQVLCGADILKPQYLKKWYEHGNISLTNLYGLTETCIDSTYFHCSKHQEELKVIPIGFPIGNTQTSIFDPCFSIPPKSAIGMLHISGEGLGRGYYRNPSLTAEKFVPNPYENGKRMFHTGDQVYHYEKQGLIFVGRADNQVKIRGLRVELDEIRTALSRHENIQKAFVQVINRQPGHTVLCAFFTADKKIDHESLCSFLSDKLPSYMIPNIFVQLEIFPLTPHGKIDSSALEIPRMNSIHSGIELNETEEILARIWAQYLNLDKKEIFPNQNFFDLGGNSLIMMQIHQSVSKQFNKSISIASFFEHPTLRSLASFFSNKSQTDINFDTLQLRYEKKKAKKKVKR